MSCLKNKYSTNCYVLLQESSIILSPNSDSIDREKNSPSPTKMIRSDEEVETLQLTRKAKKNSLDDGKVGGSVSESEVEA